MEPMEPQRDHGVAGEKHWLLDEELVPRMPMRVARPRPALLRHEPAPQSADERVAEVEAPSSDAFRFALGLLAAVAIYLLLRGADVSGALESPVPTEREASALVAATLGAVPEARLAGAEVAALRALLEEASVPQPPLVEATASPPAEQDGLEPPAKEEPVLSVQPPEFSPLPEVPEARKLIEDLERATGFEPATLSLEGR